MCFGGPAAHIGYFRQELVIRRQWITEDTLAEFIGLTQLLPGPGSSQTGFLIGISRGGLWGGLAAWGGFTLPSAILMMLFAEGVQALHDRWAMAALHGLQVAAIAVVANAVLGMARRFCPDLARMLIAVFAAALVTWQSGAMAQIGVILVGAVVGWAALRLPASLDRAENALPITRRAAFVALALFGIIFGAIELWGRPLLSAFYRTGALVFGGGHVVLPLLEQAVVRPGWVTESDFLAGYGAAQTIPGPLFTFSAYLGYVSRIGPGGIPGGVLATLAIFLPGLLLAIAIAPFWQTIRALRGARSTLGGVNAAVVGLLMAALLHAASSGAIRDWTDGALSVAAFLVLWRTKISPVAIVLTAAAISTLLAVIV